jgi:hypothetical protein
MTRHKAIKVVSDGHIGSTEVYDAETDENLTEMYCISDVELYLEDGAWRARLTFPDVELDIDGAAGERA